VIPESAKPSRLFGAAISNRGERGRLGRVILASNKRKPEKTVTAPLKLILLATSAAALAFTAGRARDAPQVAAGFVARVICSETFVSRLVQPVVVEVDHDNLGRRVELSRRECGQPNRARADLATVDPGRTLPLSTPHSKPVGRMLLSITSTSSSAPAGTS
jgi:hypothetical protein